ncbi:hypothetical protein BV20DRAFT_959727 [Pilatotrama ljubarskyi]|nr:hypothetical protein BV20DRAFT_959727 [Pilatotrama ljubarskyi]
MSALDDHLAKQIFIEKNVVTYRSLSRHLGLHVNAAKTELAKFHAQSVDSATRSFATYLVSGELFPTKRTRQSGASTQLDDGMDVDSEGANSQDEEEEAPTTTLTLVSEKDLEHLKSKYARIFSVHVYCLSQSPLTDAGLICDPSAVVYKADAKDWPTSSIALGRVVGPDVKIGKAPPPVASSSKAAEPISRKPTLKVKTDPSEKSEESLPAQTASTSISSAEKEKPSSVKPKASGKLDWTKAKKTPQDSEKGKVNEAKVTVTVKKEESTSPVETAAKKTAKLELKDDSPKDDGKRGVKRKVAPPAASDTEEKPKSREKEKSTPAAASTPADIKLRKNRIVSDDEDEEGAPAPASAKPKGKSKSRASVIADVLESEAEESLRAMMDIDDALVEKASASRPAPRKPEPESEPTEDEDVEMAQEPEPELIQEQDDNPKPRPLKKKEKKIVPVGRNGLKKKRVMKSRMTVDAKGYMVTEDYSSYESVDEEVAEEEPPKKGKGKKANASSVAPSKTKKPASTDADASDEEPAAKPKPVARTSSTAKSKKTTSAKGNAQGSLKDFFGKPKK